MLFFVFVSSVATAELQIITVEEPPTNQMLLADRIDLVISSDLEMESILKKLNLSVDSVEQVFIFEEAQSYIVASKNTPQETVDQWKNAFDALKKTNFFKVTTEKYKKILGDKLEYLPEKGFYIKN